MLIPAESLIAAVDAINNILSDKYMLQAISFSKKYKINDITGTIFITCKAYHA